jgi:hypothetical protein
MSKLISVTFSDGFKFHVVSTGQAVELLRQNKTTVYALDLESQTEREICDLETLLSFKIYAVEMDKDFNPSGIQNTREHLAELED